MMDGLDIRSRILLFICEKLYDSGEIVSKLYSIFLVQMCNVKN